MNRSWRCCRKRPEAKSQLPPCAVRRVSQKRLSTPGAIRLAQYAWRNKFGGVKVKEVRRLRELEKENARLKKLLADRDLEIDCLKEVASKNW